MRAFCWSWGGRESINLSISALVYFFPSASSTTVSGASGGAAAAGAGAPGACSCGGAGVPGAILGSWGVWLYTRAENRISSTNDFIGGFLVYFFAGRRPALQAETSVYQKSSISQAGRLRHWRS